MKVNQMFPSKFLKATDIPKTGLAATIKAVTPGTMTDRKTGEVKRIYALTFAEPDIKPLTLNKTNAQTIAGWYGDDSDDWAGKPITIERVRGDAFGKTVWLIRVKSSDIDDDLDDDDLDGETQEPDEEIPF